MRVKPYRSIHLARRLLQQQYAAPLTIDELSRQVAVSPYHLIRTFKRLYKQTPHQYLVGQRLEKAKQLLRHTDSSITDICLAVGFESLGSFSSLFRKSVGLSPRAYRRRSRPNGRGAYIPLCICLLHGLKDELAEQE